MGVFFFFFSSTAQILSVQSRMILTEPTPLASYRFLCTRYAPACYYLRTERCSSDFDSEGTSIGWDGSVEVNKQTTVRPWKSFPRSMLLLPYKVNMQHHKAANRNDLLHFEKAALILVCFWRGGFHHLWYGVHSVVPLHQLVFGGHAVLSFPHPCKRQHTRVTQAAKKKPSTGG